MQMKLVFIAGSLFALVLGAVAIRAQETVKPSLDPGRQSNVDNRQEIRKSRPGGGPNLQENLLKRKENIATRQAIRSEKKAEFQAAREEFQTKLQTLKDEKKKLVVERLDRRLTEINQNQTNKMNERLTRMTEIAGRIQERITALAGQGVDTTAAQTSLDNAKTAIESSQTAVADQAGREYVIALTDEAALKNAVGTTTSQLHADLTAVHKTVITAKQALATAHKTLLSIGPNLNEAVPPPFNETVPITAAP